MVAICKIECLPEAVLARSSVADALLRTSTYRARKSNSDNGIVFLLADVQIAIMIQGHVIGLAKPRSNDGSHTGRRYAGYIAAVVIGHKKIVVIIDGKSNRTFQVGAAAELRARSV